MFMASAVLKSYLPVEDYLAGELVSEVKHEYVGGEVYAMSGSSVPHNDIALNAYSALRPKLKGGPCKAHVSDIKVRLMVRGKDIFYYPDLVVGCDPRDTHRYALRFPKLIIEVLSPATNRIDRTEKLQNYLTIPTLEEYLLVDQDQPQVLLYRRRTDWAEERTDGLTSGFHLESVDLTLPMNQLYEDVAGITAPP